MNLLLRLEKRSGRIITTENTVVLNSLAFNVLPMDKVRFLSTISGKKLYVVLLCDSAFKLDQFASKCYVPLLTVRELISFENSRAFRDRWFYQSGLIEYGINHSVPYFPDMSRVSSISPVGKTHRMASFDAGSLFFIDEANKNIIFDHAVNQILLSGKFKVPNVVYNNLLPDLENPKVKELINFIREHQNVA